jgi:hypothetical protein
MDFRQSRDWNAWTAPTESGSVVLHVSGLVETTATHHMPEIPEASPQGVEPDILVLDLVIVPVGQNGEAKTSFRKAQFSKKTVPARYKTIHIKSEGAIIAQFPVVERSGDA